MLLKPGYGIIVTSDDTDEQHFIILHQAETNQRRDIKRVTSEAAM